MVSATKTIEGFAAEKKGELLKPITYEAKIVGDFDVEVKITHCGICHSDLHLIDNDWNSSIYPLVPGHEIIGHITQKGKYVPHLQVGQRVGIGWQCDSCHQCDWCRQGEENLCLSQQATCVGHHGGFANAIIVNNFFVFPIPENLKSENAAPLLCGGATVYAPLKHQGITPASKVGVYGIGGLGHLALQFAHAMGCEVFAFSSSAAKEKEAKEFGASHYLPTSHLDKFKNSLDLVLYTSSEMTDFSKMLTLLRPKGKMCLLGAPKGGHINVPIFSLIDGRKSILGSNIANPSIIQEMLTFAARHGISAKTELFPMSEVNTAIAKLKKGQIHYRAVLVI